MLRRLEPLTVVIPAFNEADRIVPTLDRVLSFLGDHLGRFEVLVVDDGSADDTLALVTRYAAREPTVSLLENGRNRGKGYAVRHGMLSGRGQWLLATDADLSTPIEEVERLAPAAEDHDIVIGSRRLPGSRIVRDQPLPRQWLDGVYNRAAQATAVPGVHDTLCGFKLFRQEAARAVFARATVDGFGFDVEALFLARRLGYRIAEVPVTWVDDPPSGVHLVRDFGQMALDLARVRLRHRDVEAKA